MVLLASVACGHVSRSVANDEPEAGAASDGSVAGVSDAGSGGGGSAGPCPSGLVWCDCPDDGRVPGCVNFCRMSGANCSGRCPQGSPGACPGGNAGGQGMGGASGVSGAGAVSGAPAGAETGSYCPGFEVDSALASTPLCATQQDCVSALPQLIATCATSRPPRDCGGPVPQHQCDVDSDCGADRVCVPGSCNETLCVGACPNTPCGADQNCSAGRCEAKACDEPGAPACPDGATCVRRDGTASCVPVGCEQGYGCPGSSTCAPALGGDVHGCIPIRCAANRDCPCGFCVLGACQPTPGYCFDTTPPV